MKGYVGNKTLLPLVPEGSPVEGQEPILLHILKSLPHGPKAIVVNYKGEAVINATRPLDMAYCHQPELNGTGGALLAAKGFIEGSRLDHWIITMGDVPLVRKTTYQDLVRNLQGHNMVVLGFRPADKKQYGVLETEGTRVCRIIEWAYWHHFPEERQESLQICNSGIYAARRNDLLNYIRILESRPHMVLKEREGKMVEVKEYFITDLIEWMHADGLRVGYVLAQDEDEVMGVDDLPALLKAQGLFQERRFSRVSSS